MLIRYYITSAIITGALLRTSNTRWIIVPILCSIIMANGSIQARSLSVTSLQQLITDNMMLLSRIGVIIGGTWLGYIGGYPILLSIIIAGCTTVALYYLSVLYQYHDGSLIRNQSSLLIIGTMYCIICYYLFTGNEGGLYRGIGSVTMLLIGAMTGVYICLTYIYHKTIEQKTLEQSIILFYIIIPIVFTTTVFYENITLGGLLLMGFYYGCVQVMRYIARYHYPIVDRGELTIDLILKGYKIADIGLIDRYARVDTMITTINSLSPTLKSLINIAPSYILYLSYFYITLSLFQGGISVGQGIIYCISFIIAILLHYHSKQGIINYDTITHVCIIGYMTIVTMMITGFASDPMTGIIVGVLWIITNALIVTQYHRLNLSTYLETHHIKRRVRANTCSAIIIIICATQLSLDQSVSIPVIIIITAVMGFTLAQSYLTLRSVSK